MSKPWALRLGGDLLGIVYLRRSPERLLYSRQMLIAALLLAVSAAALAHVLFAGLDAPYALLKLVCELGLFVLGLNLAVRMRVRRERVLKMALALLLISGLGDLVVIGLGFAPLDPVRQVAAGLVFTSQAYGAANCVQFGLSATWLRGAAWVLGYVVAVLLLFEVTGVALSAIL